ncbi:hypothetical protein HF086_002977 [Spodoptera exigua]|uniref:Uncharacterized protein n=1 Tax=Spodoptera exigua TaxID=7107 RepID=A0A922SLI5_SPOEX|nr:hypothetical protein HF086_002977 [Spodoptera exigua]
MGTLITEQAAAGGGVSASGWGARADLGRLASAVVPHGGGASAAAWPLLPACLQPNIEAHGSAGGVLGRDVVDDARDERPAGARRGLRGAPPGRRPGPRRELVDLAARAGCYIATGLLFITFFLFVDMDWTYSKLYDLVCFVGLDESIAVPPASTTRRCTGRRAGHTVAASLRTFGY